MELLLAQISEIFRTLGGGERLARSKMNKAVAVTIAAVAALVGFGLSASAEILPGPVSARVLRVLDGDTFVAEIQVWFGQVVTERVRIVGIDASEIGTHARCEAEAAERSRQYLAGLLGRGPVELVLKAAAKWGPSSHYSPLGESNERKVPNMPIDRIIDASQVRVIPGPPLPAEEHARLVKATKAYIAAAGALDATGVAAMLAEDVTYESQWTLEPIKGRQAVGDYITKKYETVRRSAGARPEFQLGRIDLPEGVDYPVALVTQFGRAESFVALAVDVEGRIVRHDFLGLVPHASEVRIDVHD